MWSDPLTTRGCVAAWWTGTFTIHRPLMSSLDSARRPIAGDPRGLSLAALVHCLWQDRWLIGVCAMGVAAIAGGLTFVMPTGYRTQASFIPAASRAPSALAGVAAQFGVGLAGGDAAQSPAFYAALVRSRGTLMALATDSLKIDGTRTTLSALWGDAADAPALQAETAIGRLEQAVDADVDARTGMVTVAVETPSAVVSLEIARELLRLVNQFNLERRQSQAGAERRFAEARLKTLSRELGDAELAWQEFLQRNRAVSPASRTRFEGDRLQREVSLRRGVLEALTQSHEQARLDEVRDTPLITIVERPMLAVRPAPRGLAAKVFIAFILGLLFGVAFSWLCDAWRRLRAEAVRERQSDSAPPSARQAA